MSYLFKERSSIVRKVSLLLMSFLFLAALPLFAATLSPTDNKLYVTIAGAGNKDGSSWANAAEGVAGLQAALAVANIKEIHVGAGTYSATTTTNKGSAPTCFVIPTGVIGSYNFSLLGGYPSDGNGERDPVKNETILTRASSVTSARIVYMESFSAANWNCSSTIDGFTISDGLLSTESSGNARNGAGICAAATHATVRNIKNCVIKDNHNKHKGTGVGGKGGGLYTEKDGVNLDSCLITNNEVLLDEGKWGGQNVWGGGIYAANNLNLSNSIVSKNRAINKSSAFDQATDIKGAYGGGLYFEQAFYSKILNTTITENYCWVVATAGANYQPQGGGVYIASADIAEQGDRQCTFNRCMITKNYTSLANCTSASDQTPHGAGVCVKSGSKANFYSCLIANNGIKGESFQVWGAGVANLNDAENARGNVVLTNCTIVKNCSGLQETRTAVQGVTLKNCILAGNGKSDNSTRAQGYSYNATNSFIGGADLNLPDYFVTPSTTQGKEDATANVSWALKEGCAAIDAGASVLWTRPTGDIGVGTIDKELDLASNARENNGTVDQGAYEYQFSPLVMEEGTSRIYVNANGTGSGASWNDATSRLQGAIDFPEVKEIWVAKGTYKPTKTVKMNAASNVTSKMFQMKEGVNVYGGFAGTEAALTDRSKGDKPWLFTNITVLDGDIDGNGSKSVGDAQHVIYFPVANIENDDGANFNYTTETIVNGFTIQNGYAGNGLDLQSAGGGFDKGGGVQMVGKSILSECIVQNNTGTWSGGGIRVGGTGAKVDSCLVTGNTATRINETGGGIYITGTATITGCEIKNNTSVAGQGGGISTLGTATITNCSIDANTAATQGGGIAISGTATITNCSIDANTAATHGGGIAMLGGGTIKNVIISNCIAKGISADAVSNGGGGVYINNTQLVTLDSCYIHTNEAKSRGGAILKTGSAELVISQTRLVNNKATFNAAGIRHEAGFIKIYNTLIAGNHLPATNWGGGGIETFSGISLFVYNSTIVNNRCGPSSSELGGGIKVKAGGSATIVNTIIWGNLQGSTKNQIEGSASLTNCAVEGRAADALNLNLNETNDHVDGPNFILPKGVEANDWADANWQLTNISRCIDAGASNAPKMDILGVKRPTYCAVDMGCYEYADTTVPLPDGYTAYYVSTTGTGDGTSWDAAADGCNENLFKTEKRIIYMKEGVYRSKKNGNGHRYDSGVAGLKVYGAFSNTLTGTDLSQRDIKKTPTVISGQKADGTRTGIIWLVQGVFDGIEFRDGSFIDPQGGGALRVNGLISLNDCVFANNSTSGDGGAVNLAPGSNGSMFTNCTFINNSTSSGSSGGAIHTMVEVKDVSFINCVVANNTSSHGAGICVRGNSKVTNCTIVNNKGLSEYAGGLRTAGGTTVVLNTIIWGNTNNEGNSKSQIGDNVGHGQNAIANATYTNCAVEWDAFPVANGITLTATNRDNTGPQFINSSFGNGAGSLDAYYASWRLSNVSPCATAGTIAGAPFQDIEGTVRGISISLGAYCAVNDVPVPAINPADATLYITKEGAGDKTGSSWENALPFARHIEAIATAGVTDVKMASGEYEALCVIELPANKILSGGYDVTSATRSLATNAKYPWDFATKTKITNKGLNARVLAISGATLDGVEIFGSTGGGVELKTAGSKMKNSMIRDCSVSGGGGGVLVSGGTAEVEGCLIRNVTATGSGGGVFASEKLVMKSTIIEKCSTGIYLTSSGNELDNILLANCGPREYDGGIQCYGANAQMTLRNSTIVNLGGDATGDYGRSAAIRIDLPTASKSYIYNTLIYHPTDNLNAGSIVTANSTDIKPYVANCRFDVSHSANHYENGGGNIESAPVFVTPISGVGFAGAEDNANWALQSSSPCINTGKALTEVICDIIGAPRPMGTAHDMGAFEFIEKITPVITGINNVYFAGTPLLIQGVHPLQDSAVSFSSDGSSYASTSMPADQGKYKVKIDCTGNDYFNAVSLEKDFYVTNATAYVSVDGTTAYGNQELFAGEIPFTHLKETIDLAGVTAVHLETGVYKLTQPLIVPTGKTIVGGFTSNNERPLSTTKPWDFTNKTEFHVCTPAIWAWNSGWSITNAVAVVTGFGEGSVATIEGTVDGVTFRDMYITSNHHCRVTVNGGTLQNSIVKRFDRNNNNTNEVVVGVHITGANSVVRNCYIGENQNRRVHSECLAGMLVAATGAVVDNCTFAQNQTSAGGVLKVNSTNCIVKNSTFVNNALNFGSYMVFANGNPVTVENTLIAYNARLNGNATNDNDGSAVFKVRGAEGKMIAKNCTIIKNKTLGAGHAQILMAEGTVAGANLSNCLIWDNNTGASAAIFVGTGTFNLSNCAYDNSMTTGALASTNPLNISNSTEPGFENAPAESTAGLITIDQMNTFLASNLGLTASSLCVNRGDNTLKPTDMTHQMGYVDIGAYESNHKGVMSSWTITLPTLQNNTIASSWPTLPKSLFTFVAVPASPNFTADCTAGLFSYGSLSAGTALYAVAFNNWKVTDESDATNKVSITVKDPHTVTMVNGTIDSLRADYTTEKATSMVAYEGYVASIDADVRTDENFNNWKVETAGTIDDQYLATTQYTLGSADAMVTAEYIAEEKKRYVSQAGAGSKKGYNWANAADSVNLTQMINTSIVKNVYIGEGRFEAAVNGDTAQGSASVSAFTLPAGKCLTGGYVANVATLDSSKTILTLAPTASNARVLRMENGTATDSTVIETLTITGGNITIGSSLQSEGVKHLGGGLFMAGANTFVNNCRVVDNHAKSGGGGIYLDGGTVVNSYIKGNTASDAATFEDNVAQLSCFRAGAGIYMVGGLLDHVVVDSNYVKEVSSVTEFSGGGVLMRGGEIKNSIIMRNGATTGAGILAAGTTPKITQCTIVENKATKPKTSVTTTGAGISALTSSLILNNAIVWGNSAATDSQISGTPTFANCAVEAIDTQVPGEALPTNENSFYLHANNDNKLGPRFKDLIKYEPKEGSVLINRAAK